MIYQHTIKRKISLKGVGLHSGKSVHLSLYPAPAGSGVRFTRSDLRGAEVLPADIHHVAGSSFATTISNSDFGVSTVEHLMSALAGLGVDNVMVKLDADEIPIMDGSSLPFVRAINRVGLREQAKLRKHLLITAPVSVADGDKRIALYPSRDFRVSYTIDYDHPVIRTQLYKISLSPKKYTEQIAKARTFGFLHEVEMLKANGFATGGSLDNAVVIGQNHVLNSGGLRYSDEFVRHKVLDAIGDLYLLGMPLIGHLVARKCGHGLHHKVARELLAHPNSWRVVEFDQGDLRDTEPVVALAPVAAMLR